MTRDEARNLARSLANADASTLFSAGIKLIKADRADAIFPIATEAARKFPDDARIQQLTGLAARAVGDSPAALAAFSAAARLAPGDALIAHSHARAALEAAQPSSLLFEKALRLAPQDGSILLGRAAARVQEGHAEVAIDELTAILTDHPLWTDGHSSLAQLRGQQGLDPLASIRAALRQHPAQPDLHRLLAATALSARDLAGADQALAAARAALGDQVWIGRLAAHTASELGKIEQADSLFSALPPAETPHDAALYARHLLRACRPEDMIALAQPWIGQANDHLLWPYLSIAWRLTDDPRWQWLEGDERLVGIYDLADKIADIAGLAEHLRSLHFAREAPLDQSVRGGTQTDGNLLLRGEQPIQALRALLLETVATHIAQLPPPEEGHPTLPALRTPQRISGAWSVRLTDAGFHSDHVHSEGWFSSALYLALPDAAATGEASAQHDGWLTLGECREVIPALDPFRIIEPKPGRLVLFPSTMWHGTRPFPKGERLTVAFDIARPNQR